jgi:glucose-6-phosphate 1-dehydrogenase
MAPRMSTAVRLRTAPVGDAPQPADVFVIFGITGDLAKVMTFHSLYRLEQRGLLDCPIVGVAGDDWTTEQGEHDVRADLEPQLHLLGADHDGRELRR